MDKNAITTAEAVIDYFIAKCIEKDYALSQTKLNKLAYYAYAWFLVASENRKILFEAQLKAYPMGPVSDLAYEYLKEGYNDILTIKMDEDVADFLEQIFNRYGECTVDELVAYTHNEPVWNSLKSSISQKESSYPKIDDDSIYEYYQKKNILLNSIVA